VFRERPSPSVAAGGGRAEAGGGQFLRSGRHQRPRGGGRGAGCGGGTAGAAGGAADGVFRQGRDGVGPVRGPFGGVRGPRARRGFRGGGQDAGVRPQGDAEAGGGGGGRLEIGGGGVADPPLGEGRSKRDGAG